jgi:hypothetical protein
MPNDVYEIVNVTPRTRSVGGTVFQKVHEVTFQTKPDGLSGTVDVPDDEFNPQHVDEVVRARVAVLQAVKAL